MGQVLRVTVGKADHLFKIVRMDISVPEKAEIEVEWLGEPLKILRDGRSWIAVDCDRHDMTEVAESIGKALTLRYRF